MVRGMEGFPDFMLREVAFFLIAIQPEFRVIELFRPQGFATESLAAGSSFMMCLFKSETPLNQEPM